MRDSTESHSVQLIVFFCPAMHPVVKIWMSRAEFVQHQIDEGFNAREAYEEWHSMRKDPNIPKKWSNVLEQWEMLVRLK